MSAVRSRGGAPRPGPYNRQGNDGDVDMAMEGENDGHEDVQEILEGAKAFIKVSGQSSVKSVAGKIAHTCRDTGEPPAALCIGAVCINQAVKAIAVARGYLAQDGLDIAFQPAFRDKDRSRASVALYLAKQVAPVLLEGHAELTVSAQSKPAVVAGALAARVREGKQVVMTAIGVDAVSNAVLTVGNTRLYLEDDNLDVRCMPEFYTLVKNGKELNGLRFIICAEHI